MKIAFFELERWAGRYVKRRLSGHEIKLFSRTLEPNDLTEIKDTEVLSPFIYSKIDRSIIEKLHELKLITTRSTGFEHIDIAKCRQSNITVCNVPSYGENTVAEHTFALILSLSRNLYKASIKRLTNDFSIQDLTGFDLKDKTLGVIGTGKIGLHVIRIAKGFGMNVLAFDVSQNKLLEEILGFNYVSMERLLSEAHIVTVHVPYNEHTHHLINGEKLKLMRNGSYLVNTARGAIVDTEALIEALDNNLAGAGLDVLEGEEFIKEETAVLSECNKSEVLSVIGANEILLHKPNVVYTPHIAFNSQEALIRILETTVQNIIAFISGEPRNVV